MPTKIKAEGIKLDVLIDIKVSGGFYARLHQLMQELASTVTPEEFQKVMQKVAAGKAETNLEYHLETLSVLIAEIEKEAKSQGKITMEEVEVPDKG
jgi:hypothetical protein